MLVLPSSLVFHTGTLSEQGQEHARLCFYNVYNALKLFSYALKQSLSANDHAGLLMLYEDLSTLQAAQEEVLEALQWAQFLSVAEIDFCGGSSFDELTRGMRHLRDTHEVAIWITFGMQLHLDLQYALGDSISDAFYEAKKDITRLSLQKKQLLESVQPLSGAYKTFCLKDISQPLDFLSDFLWKDDKLFKEMYHLTRGKDQDTLEAAMGRSVQKRHWFWKHNPILCGLIKCNLTKILRKGPLTIECTTGIILVVTHLYNICKNLFPKFPYWPDMECKSKLYSYTLQ
ncbi:hypothetical protein Ptr902_11668 [Pyrenophora tritici-repentis]|nr:hypothetical protein Ptr902_11668 [Pyrenophora tritici-repentis]